MRFRLLGTVEIEAPGERIVLARRQERCLLAILLLEAGRAVSCGKLAELLWEGAPPGRARRIIHGHISRLRSALTRPAATEAGLTLTTVDGGYSMILDDPQSVDAHRFRALAAAARSAGSPAEAVELLREAVYLWRGPALQGTASDWQRDQLCAGLEELRLGAVAELAAGSLALGRERDVVELLATSVAAHPERERLAELYMQALHRLDRRVDALAVFDRTRTYLVEELGLDPSQALQKTHRAILRNESAATATSPEPSHRFVPATLPAGVAGFTGRVEQLGLLDTFLLGSGGPSGTVAVAAISGMAGVGKTSLAVHWAHRVAGHFPDGQLYANLRGFGPDPTPMSAAEVVRDFLAALHVSPEQIPAGLDAQLGMYRSLLMGKRILVLLDNARNADHVRQLLPGTSGCAAVVTSRNQLTSLAVAPGAYLLALDLLSADEAHDLLGRRLGPDRLTAEPAGTADIVAQCAGLPLALAIVAAQACARPALPLAKLANRIRKAPNVLDEFAGGDAATDPRQVFASSYQTLSPAAARLFRFLSLHPGPDVTPAAAASLANLSLTAASALLAELTTAHLVTSPAPDRYVLHDLLRAYAAELAAAVDPGQQLQVARQRLLNSYLRMALAAANVLAPNRSRITPAYPPGPAPANVPMDDNAARAWFDAEHRTVRAAVTLSTRTGFDAHGWQLAWAILPYWERCGRWHDALSTQQEALAGAQRLADRTGEAHASRLVGYALTMLDRPDDAWSYLVRALDLFCELGDPASQARAHANIYIALGQQQRFQDALRHARRALELHQTAGNSAAVPGALNNLGVAYGLTGDHRRSLAYGRRALALFQQRGHRHGEAAAWDTMGHAHHQLGVHTQAIACYLKSLEAYRVIDSRFDQVEVLTHLGDAYHAAGDDEAARDRWTQAISILEEIGHPGVDGVRGKLTLLATTGEPST